MRTKKSFLMMLLFMCIIAGSVLFNHQDSKADSNPYYIKVNKGTNVVTVYKSDDSPYKAFVCSTGSATPVGTFYTSQKLRWHTLMGPSYGQYCTRIVNGILFHSVWYYNNYDKASQSTVQYNNLGTTASHGCVRLTVADCKWIYDNCTLGTKVIIFNGGSSDDPLGKPEAVKVSTASRMGWDPTDPDSENPYLKMAPTITTEKDKYDIIYYSNIDIKSFATARAAYATYLNSYLEVYIKAPGATKTTKFSGKFYRFNMLGTYTVTYKVKDPKNSKTASKSIKITVNDTGAPVITKVPAQRTVSYNTTLDLKSSVQVKTGSGTDMKKNMTVTITTPDKKTVKLTSNKYKFTKLGVYTVKYVAKNPANQKSSTKTTKVTVKDTKPPIISGVGAVTKEYKSKFNVKSGVTAKTTTGTNITGRIKISVKDPSGANVTVTNNCITLSKRGMYKITYKVTGLNGKITTKVRNLKSVDTGAPILKNVPTASKTVGCCQSMNLRAGITAVTAKGTNLTSAIKISVKYPNGSVVSADNIKTFVFNNPGVYVVTYKITNSASNKSASKSVKYFSKYKPVLTVPSSFTYDLAKEDGKINVMNGVTCVNAYGNKSTLKKFVTCSATFTQTFSGVSGKSVTIKDNTFVADKVGTYKVTCEVSDTNKDTSKVSGTNVITTTKSYVINVIDSSTGYDIDVEAEIIAQAGDDIAINDGISFTTKSGVKLNGLYTLEGVYIVDENGNKTAVEVQDGKIVNAVAGQYIVENVLTANVAEFYTGINKLSYSFNVEPADEEGDNENNNNNQEQ